MVQMDINITRVTTAFYQMTFFCMGKLWTNDMETKSVNRKAVLRVGGHIINNHGDVSLLCRWLQGDEGNWICVKTFFFSSQALHLFTMR